MIRVIAGIFGSRRLKTLEGGTTRPTSDRLKGTLFNLLQTRIEGARFLDCFSGSGGIGIEALSRGAGSVVLVESSSRAVRVIHENLKLLNLINSPACQLICKPASVAFQILRQDQKKFDIVFLDPPYASTDQYVQVLEQLQEHDLLEGAAIVIAEHSKRFEISDRILRLMRYREIRQGDSRLSLFCLEEPCAKP